MTELPARLAEVSESAEELHALEEKVVAARARFYERLRAAHAAGATYALLGRIAGISRQAISQVLKNDTE
jgi:hypothetical protein